MSACLGLLLVYGLAIQEDSAKKDIVQEARKALLATVEKGGYRAVGETQFDLEKADDELAEWAKVYFGAFDGSLRADITYPFRARVKLKQDKKVYEIFHRSGETAERITWRGFAEAPLTTRDEVLSILNLKHISGELNGVKKAARAKDEDVGEVKCRSIQLTFEGLLINKYGDPEDDAEEEEDDMPIDRVEIRLWIGQEDGLIHRLEAKLFAPVDLTALLEEEGDDQKKTKCVVRQTYSLRLLRHGAAVVRIPGDIFGEEF